jgi:uncharacterized protein YjcR
MAARYNPRIRQLAKGLFKKGYTMEEIRDELRIASTRVIYIWRENEKWDEEVDDSDPVQTLTRRLVLLTEKDKKTRLELDEQEMLIKRIGTLSIQLAEARRIDRTPVGAVPTPPGEDDEEGQVRRSRGKREKKEKKVKNDISAITPEMLAEVRNKLFYSYQLEWWARKNDPETRRTRFILKSRQIGATYYFAWEAFEDAVLTGDNQIFLSSSRDQAEVFKAYIIAFAKEYFGIDLKGNPIVLSNGAEIRFVSTNASTAASYHGHLYVDEIFWIPNFKKVWDQASGMASHKKWRRTLFSVPSAISHPAYELWSGAHYNRHKSEKQKAVFDISHEALMHGEKGADRFWRQIVTVEDAEAAGCDLFDLEELQTENGGRDGDAYKNKYLCQFIDDAKSAFPLAQLLACGVEPGTWKDFKPELPRPFGNRPVAIGYDPSRTGDNAAIVVMAVPLKPTEKWRVLERLSLKKVAFEYQANRIRDMMKRYNVIHIGIDVSSEGQGVWAYLQDIPCAMPITYSLPMKNSLVVKALDVIQPPPRLEYDVGDTGITQAFLMIKKTVTEGTSQVTYTASRNATEGHADVAWAIMHAMIYEPINAGGRAGVRVAFSD